MVGFLCTTVLRSAADSDAASAVYDGRRSGAGVSRAGRLPLACGASELYFRPVAQFEILASTIEVGADIMCTSFAYSFSHIIRLILLLIFCACKAYEPVWMLGML
jgi:hypothetical protein